MINGLIHIFIKFIWLVKSNNKRNNVKCYIELKNLSSIDWLNGFVGTYYGDVVDTRISIRDVRK